MANEVTTIYVAPGLIETETREGKPILGKDGEALARISVPPAKEGGEWGTFVVKAAKVNEAKSKTSKGENYKYVSFGSDYEINVRYGTKDNHHDEKITAADLKKQMNPPKKEKAAEKQAEAEAEQEGPELD